MLEFLFFFNEVDFVHAQNLSPEYLWYFLPIGYLTTILIETPVLLFGLSPKLSFKQKLLCGFWLTACTYPIVILVLPALLLDHSKTLYITVAEIFAPAAECFFFWLAFRGKDLFAKKDWIRSFAATVVANLLSFGIGEILHLYRWFGLLGY